MSIERLVEAVQLLLDGFDHSLGRRDLLAHGGRAGFQMSVHSIERSLIAFKVYRTGLTAKVTPPRLSAKLSQKYSIVSDLENQSLLMRRAPGRGRPTTDGTDRMRHPANSGT